MIRVDVPPWQLSGTVLGALVNDAATLAAIGDALHAAPYKAPPRAPVLGVKPRNTWLLPLRWPAGVGELELAAQVGLVIAQPARPVDAQQALACIGGAMLVAELTVPLGGASPHYRPALRQRALDGSLKLGEAAVLPGAVFEIEVLVDGQPAHTASSAGFVRGAAQLLADVSEFMTLQRGDVLLLGAADGAPRVRAGQQVQLRCAGLPPLTFEVPA